MRLSHAPLLLGGAALHAFVAEGLARLEVVDEGGLEVAVRPHLAHADAAFEALAAGADRLPLVEQVLDRRGRGEALAEALFDPRREAVHRVDGRRAERHAALEAVGEVDVELGGQGEGGRGPRLDHVAEDLGGRAVEPLAAPHVGGADVERHPLGGPEGEVGREVVGLRVVVVDPQRAEHVGVVGVGGDRLVDFVALERRARRERVFVREHQREAHVVGVGRDEVRIADLVGVVGDLHAPRREVPEAGALDRAGILRDERVGAVVGQRVGEVGVGEEREVLLSRLAAAAAGGGVFAADARHEAPASEVGRCDAVERRDVFHVVVGVALGVVAQPLLAAQPLVEGVVAHVVVGVLGAGLQAPAGREALLERERQCRHVVGAARVVAVELSLIHI